MSSKFPSRREKRHTTKPYDRPKSFLQRVTSRVAAVADYLPTWMNPVGWSLGGSSVSDQQEEPTDDVDEETEAETEEDESAGPSGQASISKVSPQRASTAGEPSFTRTPLKRNSPETQQPTLANGDDHSDNSETSASTSGCSSLAPSQEKKRAVSGASGAQLKGLQVSKRHLQQIQQQLGASPAFEMRSKSIEQPSTSIDSPSVELPRVRIDVSIPRNTRERSRRSVLVRDDTPMSKAQEKDAESSSTRTSLWSEEDERSSLMGKRTLMSRPQPVAPSKRPCFTPSAFGSPLRVPQSQPQFSTEERSSIFSPFYQGQTTYGGASAYKKARLYNSTLRAEVMKVRQSSSKDVLSSAAQRVLNVLENMSTPLTDAKKIPVEHVTTDFTLSYTPSIYARRPLRLDSSVTPILPAGPPRTSFPLQTSAPRHQRPSSILASLSQAGPSRAENTSRSITSEVILEKRSGGKVRTKVSHSERASTRNQKLEDEYLVADGDLPQVSLPVIPSLPAFSFQRLQPPPCTSTPMASNPSSSGVFEGASPSTLPCASGFSFSSPIDKIPPPLDPPQERVNSFQFRSPVVKSGSPDASEQSRPGSLSKTPTVMFNFSAPVSSSGSTSPLKRKAQSENVGKVPALNVSPMKAAPELIVGGSVMDILGKTEKDVSSITKKILDTSAEAKGFGSSFQRKSNEWECSECMVRNKDSDASCIACSTERPSEKNKSAAVVPLPTSTSGFGNQFSAPSGSWCCPVCMINNTESANNCVACSELKPGASKSALKTSSADATSMNSLPASVPQKWVGPPVITSGTWECDTCLVRNNEGTARCCACETPRLNIFATTDIKDNFTGFKFGQQPQTSTVNSSFKFGNQVTSKDATRFKFGLPSSFDATASVPNVSEGFKFSAPIVTNTTSVFGGQSNQALGSTGTFKFGLPCDSSVSKTSDKAGSQIEGNKAEAVCVTSAVLSSSTDKSVPSDSGDGKSATGQGKFVFGQSSVTEGKLEVTPTLTFGQNVSETTQSTSRGFTFGKTVPESATSDKSDAVVQGSEPVSTGMFSFGGSSVKPTVTTPATTSASVDTVVASDGFKYSFPSTQNSKSTENNSSTEKNENPGTVAAFSFGGSPKSQTKVTEATTATNITPSGFQFTFKGNKESVDTDTTVQVSQPVTTPMTSWQIASQPGITISDNVPSMPVFSVCSSSTTPVPKAVVTFRAPPQAITPGIVATAPINTTSGNTSTGAFVFGSTKPAQATPVVASFFSFGANNNVAAKPAVANTPFSFGMAQTTSTPSVNPVLSGSSTGFSFAAKPSATLPSATGMVQQPSASSVFTFGATNTEKPSTSVASAFGVSQPQKPVFGGVFSSNTMSSPTPFGQQQPQQHQQQLASNVPSSDPFRFGASNPAAGNAPAGGMFQFGVSKPAIVSAPNNNNNSGAGVFRFGAQENNNSQQQQPVFGGTTQVTSPGGGFTFGASPATNSSLVDGSGNFPPAVPDGSPFVFGNVPTAVVNPNSMVNPTPFQFQAGNPAAPNPFNPTPTAGAPGRQIRKAIRRVTKKK